MIHVTQVDGEGEMAMWDSDATLAEAVEVPHSTCIAHHKQNLCQIRNSIME